MLDKLKKKFSDKYNLKYDVMLVPNPKDFTCRVSTDTKEKRHTITVDRYTLADPARAEYLLAHEFANAYLAENLDISFGCMPFAAEYTQSALRMAFQAYMLPVDWWTNAVRHRVFPEYTSQEMRANIADYARAPKECDFLFSRFELRQCLALDLAENKKYKCGQEFHLRKLVDRLSRGNMESVFEIRDFLLSMGTLSENRDKALALLQLEVRRYAALLRLPIALSLSTTGENTSQWWISEPCQCQ